MHRQPHLSSSTAERKVKLESFPDIKPRRGAILSTRQDISDTPDCDIVISKPQRTFIRTLAFRSRDQIRQNAGRSGGIFEIAVDATTSWDFQYAITEGNQQVTFPSSRALSLDLDVAETGKENVVPQITIPTPFMENKANLPKADGEHGELRFFGARGRKKILSKNADTRYRSSPAVETIVKKPSEPLREQEDEFGTSTVAHYAKKSQQGTNVSKYGLEGDITEPMPTTKRISLLHNDEEIPRNPLTCSPARVSSEAKDDARVENIDQHLFCKSGANVYDAAIESVECVIERCSLGPGAALCSEFQAVHASTVDSYTKDLGNDFYARHVDFVSRWSDTTFSTDSFTPISKPEVCVSATSTQSPPSASTSRPLTSSSELPQSSEYASFPSQFCRLLHQGYGDTRAYDQVMPELTENGFQEGQQDEDDSNSELMSLPLTEPKETKAAISELPNKWLTLHHREKAYRLLCGTNSQDFQCDW